MGEGVDHVYSCNILSLLCFLKNEGVLCYCNKSNAWEIMDIAGAEKFPYISIVKIIKTQFNYD